MFVRRNAERLTLNIQRRTFCIRFSVLDVRCSRERGSAALHLISQPLLVPMRPHSLAALVLGNFCFSSFLERAHSDFQSRRLRFNHLIRCTATAIGRDILFTVKRSARSNEANDGNRLLVRRVCENLTGSIGNDFKPARAAAPYRERNLAGSAR